MASRVKLPVVIRFRATRVEARLLEKLARHYERTPSWVLRRLVADGAKVLAHDTTDTNKES
jgi:hypothetical protein